MKKNRLITMGLMLSLATWTCGAGDIITLRMVEASNNGVGVDEKLSDVGSLLTTQLPYKRLQLIDQQTGKIPGAKTLTVKHDYTVQYSGTQSNLDLTIVHKNKKVLKTTVQLRDSKPLILGGFSSPKGKFIFVLLTK